MPFVDHMSLAVSDHDVSGRFYDAVLAPLGARRRFREGGSIGYSSGPMNGGFSICKPKGEIAVQPGMHVCFAASTREEVELFHAAGLGKGGTDNGAPGYRSEYARDYYGAFLLDPDGNHLGVVARVAPDRRATPRARIIDHLSLGVADRRTAVQFYDALFETLDVERLFESPDFVAFGVSRGDSALFLNMVAAPPAPLPHAGHHVCFSAATRDQVDAFHARALAAGGRDNGRPGPRPDYAPDYYGAFAFDPEGNHIGAVTRMPRG